MSATGAITIVSVSSGTNPAARSRCGRSIGPVVPMQLPLEALAALGEHVHLARDQLVEVGTLEPAEVAIDDEAAACPDRRSAGAARPARP